MNKLRAVPQDALSPLYAAVARQCEHIFRTEGGLNPQFLAAHIPTETDRAPELTRSIDPGMVDMLLGKACGRQLMERYISNLLDPTTDTHQRVRKDLGRRSPNLVVMAFHGWVELAVDASESDDGGCAGSTTACIGGVSMPTPALAGADSGPGSRSGAGTGANGDSPATPKAREAVIVYFYTCGGTWRGIGLIQRYVRRSPELTMGTLQQISSHRALTPPERLLIAQANQQAKVLPIDVPSRMISMPPGLTQGAAARHGSDAIAQAGTNAADHLGSGRSKRLVRIKDPLHRSRNGTAAIAPQDNPAADAANALRLEDGRASRICGTATTTSAPTVERKSLTAHHPSRAQGVRRAKALAEESA